MSDLWGLHTAADDGGWYHVTHQKLSPGDRITPGGGESHWTDDNGYADRGNHVWLSDDDEHVGYWLAQFQKGEEASGLPHLYEVNPDQPPTPYDETDPLAGKVTSGATVVRQHEPLNFMPWLDGHHTASSDGIRYAHVVEADVADDLMHLAGKFGDLPEGLTFTHGKTFFDQDAVNAHLGDRQVGQLTWKNDDNWGHTIDYITVHPEFRRHGIGTAMLNHIRDNIDPKITHSRNVTPAGRGFAKADGFTPPPFGDGSKGKFSMDPVRDDSQEWPDATVGNGMRWDDSFWRGKSKDRFAAVKRPTNWGPDGDWQPRDEGDGMMTLYHRTSPESADEIINGQRFLPGKKWYPHEPDKWQHPPTSDQTWFSTSPQGRTTGGYDERGYEKYGPAVVKVRVPKEKVYYPAEWMGVKPGDDVHAYVYPEDLDGVPITRHARLAMPRQDAYDKGTLKRNFGGNPDQAPPFPGPWFHGSPDKLEVGDILHPGAAKNYEYEGDRAPRQNWVFMDLDARQARMWAGEAVKQRQMPHDSPTYVYHVEPLDEGPWPWNEYPDMGYASPRARVVERRHVGEMGDWDQQPQFGHRRKRDPSKLLERLRSHKPAPVDTTPTDRPG